MSSAEVYLLLGLFMAAMFGAIIYFGQKGVEATRRAEHIVAGENVNESFQNTDEKISFRKPYLISVMLLVLFLVATYIFLSAQIQLIDLVDN